ncbi:MAG: triphosphoribosyl-dephospho-CoA synthase MdcB [Mesorhizobium sp.]|nr:MAG: triphosphoribosyl-dephospho-CoA synthase MdcB [Mesorhizobium sp.]
MRTTSLRVSATLPKRAPAHGRAPLAPVDAERFGGMAADALLAELDTWPKPGLVSPLDNGSHGDMDYGTFVSSINGIRSFYAELAAAGAACAERRRLSSKRLTRIVVERWGREITRGPIPLNSHGSDALRRFDAGGARAEAAAGFPHARTIGLPALLAGRVLTGDEGTARVHAFFALLAVMEDTNLLHRGGTEGLRDAHRAACDFLLAGGVGRTDWLAHAMAVHRAFVARRLSPGGSADLLAVTIFLDHVENTP